MPHIFDVTELTAALKEAVEGEFPFVWVRGQVGNLARPASGHVYFTLKDDFSVLPVVWFRSNRLELDERGADPLTGEVFENGRSTEIEEGAEVLCAGRLSVYQPRGAYQLIAELVQERGQGELHARFEALKKKLLGLGYFDPGRKRPIPESPVRVAVVTSSRGAAIRDFVRVASERGAGAEIRVYDCLVQGEAAAPMIADALSRASSDGWAEAVVLMRGGGSIEDLWAFNEETVARAVFESAVPVLTGIGHEVDTTIADLTADRRAATPSHAAQLLWPERRTLVQAVDELEMDLARSYKILVEVKGAKLAEFFRALAWLSPARRIERACEVLDRESRALVSAAGMLVERKSRALAEGERRLAGAFGPTALRVRGENVKGLAKRLLRAGDDLRRDKEMALALAESRLSAVNPLGPLERGYALVTLEKTGRYMRSVKDAAPGDVLEVRVADGSVSATVDRGGGHG
jgi:exodeoxyribonuclease VII large subunit